MLLLVIVMYCDGLGKLMEIDEDLVIPNKDLSIKQGAICSIGVKVDLRDRFIVHLVYKVLS